MAMPHEQAPDQRQDDSLSLCFDSEPLDSPLEILGDTSLDLQISSDKPLAMVAVRLNDVRPDGSVTKVTMGILNLTHRDSSEFPEPLELGRWYSVKIALSSVGYRFPVGHRLRVSISPSYWPVAWPSSERVSLRIRGLNRLSLPQYAPRAEISVAFEPPETAPRPEIVNLKPGRPFERTTSFDFVGNTITRRLAGTGGYGADGLNLISDIGLKYENDAWRQQTISLDDPCSAATEFHQHNSFHREGWDVKVQTRVRVTSTKEDFMVECDLDIFEDGRRILARSWNPRLPRGCI